MALDGFSVLLPVPPAPEVLAVLKQTIYTAFCTLNVRLEFSHNAIENKVYYGLATTLYYFQIRKRNESTDQKSKASPMGEQGTRFFLLKTLTFGSSPSPLEPSCLRTIQAPGF